MKKLVLLLVILMGSLVANGQSTIKFEKMGTPTLKVKIDGVITVTDSTLNIHSTYKGKVSDYTLRIISKDVNETSSTYKCEGQVGTSDRHQFLFVPSKGMGIWTMVNSTTFSVLEQYMALSK